MPTYSRGYILHFIESKIKSLEQNNYTHAADLSTYQHIIANKICLLPISQDIVK